MRPAREVDGTAREDDRSETAAGGDDAASLVESALRLRWSAPELALLLADRATATGAGGAVGQRAALIAAASLNGLGREVEAGTRALAGLRLPSHVDHGCEGDLDRQLRVELATAAAAVGVANTALGVLRPVLPGGPGTGPAVRASALVQLAAVLARLGLADTAAVALREADDLYRGDADVEPDLAVLLRAEVRAARSALHRRHGEMADAEAAARDGLQLMSALSDPAQDGGAVRGRLVMELTLSLLDRGELDAALRGAATVLDGSVRAAAAPSRAWLQLALATRVHLPAGRHREALDLLGDAAASAQRHSLEPVLAECLDGLCQVHEERGEYAEALRCLRSAHAAGYRHRHAADALRIELIEEYGTPRRDVAGLTEQVVGLIGSGRVRRHRSDAPGLLDPAGFVGRAEVVLAATHPGRAISLALVAVDRFRPLDAGGTGAEPVLARIAEQLRDAAPARGVLGRLDSDRFGVLLPGAGRVAALDWAQRLRAAVAAGDWSELTEDRSVTINVGVAEHDSGVDVGELLAAADRALADAKSHDDAVAAPTVLASPVALVAVDSSQAEGVESAHQDPESGPGAGRARHRRDGGQQRPVAELLSAAGRTSGANPGRRRAEDRPETSEDGTESSTPSTLVSEPPLGSRELVDDAAANDQSVAERGGSLPEDIRSRAAAPTTIRSLDSTILTDRIGEDSREIGLGDLLAEALVAFDEGRRSRGSATGAGAAGDQLTDPMIPAVGSGSGTGSELGMPDRTTEQVWQSPETRRHSAAGE